MRGIKRYFSTGSLKDLKSEIDLTFNYCEKTVARSSAASRRDRRLRNEAAAPVRRIHDPEAKLQRKELRPRKAARRLASAYSPALPISARIDRDRSSRVRCPKADCAAA